MKADLSKIKNKYDLHRIFEYINDYKFKFKLFKLSASFQKKLDLALYKYQEEYLKQFGINLVNYFSYYNDYNFDTFSNNLYYEKEKKKEKIEEEYLKSKYDLNIIKNFVDGYFKDYKENINKILDINSPFFNTISKAKKFDEIFIIPVLIEKEADKKKYLTVFKELNENNQKYSLLFEYIYENDINYFKELNINFNKINRLIIRPNFVGMIKTNQKYDNLINTLCSFNNTETTLKFLSLDLSDLKIESDVFENINNFKSLEHLQLMNIIFKKTFILKLNTLKSLSLINCRNISLSKENSSNLKKFEMSDSYIAPSPTQNALISFPALEELILDNFYPVFEKYKSIIDFNSIKKIKKLSANISDFNNLDLECLEKVRIVTSRKELSMEKEKKMLEKIISIKVLEEIDIPLSNLDDKELSKIKDDNNSIKKVTINWYNEIEECILDNLYTIFPNLSSLNIQLSNGLNNCYYNLDIQENPNCKINDFCINGNGKTDINFDIKSLECLTKIDINSNIEDFPPIFYTKNNVIFKSLTVFRLNINNSTIQMDVLKNICKIIDNMPKLKDFKINCILESKDLKNNIPFLRDCFVKKLLTLRLNSLEFIIKTDKNVDDTEYTIKELKDNYHIIKCTDLFNIKINKFN